MKIKRVLPENQDKDTSTYWAFATIGKTKPKIVIIVEAHTRESSCAVGRRGIIQSSKHMVCCRPPADHHMWEDYVTIVRLAAKHTNQPSQLQTTLKSLAQIKPYNSFSFLCSFPFLIIIITILLWIKPELVTYKAAETDPCHLISPWGTDRGCCKYPCVSACAVRMCIVCVCVCVCVRQSEKALNSYYLAFKLKPAEPMPSWEAVCWSCSRFRLSASPTISQQ